jgi:hypothetical protein
LAYKRRGSQQQQKKKKKGKTENRKKKKRRENCLLVLSSHFFFLQDVHGKRLEVAYSAPRTKDLDRPDADTLFVLKRGDPAAKPLDPDALSNFFSQWGDVKRVGGNNNIAVQKFVQFFDVRAHDKALQEANGLAYDDGTLSVEEAKSNFGPGGKDDRGERGDRFRRRSRSRSRDRDRERHRPRRSRSPPRRRRSRSRSPRKRRSRSNSRDRFDRHKHSKSDTQFESAALYGGSSSHFQPPLAIGPQDQQILQLVHQNPHIMSLLMGIIQQQQNPAAAPMPNMGGASSYSPPQHHQGGYNMQVLLVFLNLPFLFFVFFVFLCFSTMSFCSRVDIKSRPLSNTI